MARKKKKAVDIHAATGAVGDQTPIDVAVLREALAEFEQMKDEAPAHAVIEPRVLSGRASGYDLAAQLRQQRHVARLAEKGY